MQAGLGIEQIHQSLGGTCGACGLDRAWVYMFNRFRKKLADHPHRMQTQCEYARQCAEADCGNEDDAHDQFGNGAQCVQRHARTLVHHPVRRSGVCGEEGERERQRDGEHGAADAHRQRIGERFHPTIPACEIRRKHFAGDGCQRGPAFRKTLRVKQARDVERTEDEGGDDNRSGEQSQVPDAVCLQHPVQRTVA